jgi:two-component system, LytTR family, sensor kinase
MDPREIAALVNLVGFVIGAALYAMLLAIVLRNVPSQSASGRSRSPLGRRLLAAAVLGLIWNAGALVVYVSRDLGVRAHFSWIMAVSLMALGFLPAVLVDSSLCPEGKERRSQAAWWITFAAYALSTSAAILHLHALLTSGSVPSPLALQTLTIGFGAEIVALVIYARRQTGWQRAFFVVALAVFAVSAFHLSHHSGGDTWWVELAGHHSSLPLALAILYQDYRFAFADIFLKRVLVLVILVALVSIVYVTIAAPLLLRPDRIGEPRAIVGLLALWVCTALIYPALRQAVRWFVDAVILRRADYGALRAQIASRVLTLETPEEILDGLCAHLKNALTAYEVRWLPSTGDTEKNLADLVQITPRSGASANGSDLQTSATVLIPLAQSPGYILAIGQLSGGRRLLSDDIAFLESVALATARRIDELQATEERYERTLREQEISRLAVEADLRALRAQLNPHFLFNALTTLGYLIQSAPERAIDTLLKLTSLLRAVLRRSEGEFVSLGDELSLIESYIAIERARFEERLSVRIDVPEGLLAVRVPPLLVLPLVENAIKHGIAPSKRGGEVVISARIDGVAARSRFHVIEISIEDTGAGASEEAFARGRQSGVGLSNTERRLECYYGEAASLRVSSAPGSGTRVELRLPVSDREIDSRSQRRLERRRA